MKHTYRYIVIIFALLIGGVSCNDFLDVMPDKRTELDSNKKLKELLVSAYPIVDPMMIYEHRTDNAMDNGAEYGNPSFAMITENYFWKDIKTIEWDAPQMLWQECYGAVSAANQVLDAIENRLGLSVENQSIKAEALMCRAYAHFMLANTFCQPYGEATADKDLGIPYIEELETVIGVKYDRGTVKDVYEKIARDIEEAYPMIDDNVYDIPLYHFNKKASAAFAARFYLFYGDYEKALKYANDVLPDNPSAVLRDVPSYRIYNSSTEITYAYISNDEPANLLLVPLRSLWGRNYMEGRYGNSDPINFYCIYGSAGPWGDSFGNNFPVYTRRGYPTKFVPKFGEIFEIINPTARTGQPHVVQMAFTTDETLMVRAEANIMLKNYDAAARDLSYWYEKKGGNPASADAIVKYYQGKKERELASVKAKELDPWLVLVKDFHAKFPIEEGTQEMMLQGLLHARRIETMHSGLRWLDIRRYGIEVIHNVDGGEPMTLAPDDLRRVIQIPAAVVSAGLTPNPR
ncbi:MAG: RagB/SusD family nutrient uptake outer membrane protein [Fermentimonas sp.]